MAINFQRLFIAITAFIIIGLTILVILQNKTIEKFSMILEKNVRLTGADNKILPDVDINKCQEECKKTPNCIAANVGEKGMGCWLKSTVGKTITDANVSSLRFPCELYTKPEFGGKGLGLDVGKYTLSNLKEKGYVDKSLMSIRLRDGYRITVYDKDAFGGMHASFIASQPNLHIVLRDSTVEPPLRWSKSVSSIEIAKIY
jgi:hypothetical protein